MHRERAKSASALGAKIIEHILEKKMRMEEKLMIHKCNAMKISYKHK